MSHVLNRLEKIAFALHPLTRSPLVSRLGTCIGVSVLLALTLSGRH